MSDVLVQSRPGWQTEELQDEWIEEDVEEGYDEDNLSYGTRSISLTAPLAAHIQTSLKDQDDKISQSILPPSPQPVGTFLVRQDIPIAPLLPKTPGRHKKGLIKDFFSPLPLERMFEPPSPPAFNTASFPPSDYLHGQLPLSHPQDGNSTPNLDRIGETEAHCGASSEGPKVSMNCQFTFAVPRESYLNPNDAGAFPQAQSTPGPGFPSNPTAPTTDPRLRLFQFQYDTFTRDHLSAMVDSIAINTPSGGSRPGTASLSPASFIRGLSRVSEATGNSFSHMRSTKRVKLSPRSDYYGEGDGEGAIIARPKTTGRDYLGEAGTLMQQIRQARDYSTISTVASAPEASQGHGLNEGDTNPSSDQDSPKQLVHVNNRLSSLRATLGIDSNPSSVSGAGSSKSGPYSSTSIRQQAEALMTQIKNDMKGQKRIFSGDTEVSHITADLEDKEASFTRSLSPERPSVHVHAHDNKENHRDHSQHHSHHSVKADASVEAKRKVGTRKMLRHLGATDGVDHGLADEVSNLTLEETRTHADVPILVNRPGSPSFQLSTSPSNVKPQINPNPIVNAQLLTTFPSTLAPPSYPSSSTRSGTNDDLNRFVSSSTASGTTLTSGSAPSFVKHQGPAQIRRITPEDVPALPEKVGKMVFDKVMMKWVKESAQAAATEDYTAGTEADGESEDPFRDISDIVTRVRPEEGDQASIAEVGEDVRLEMGMSRIEEQSELDDAEEVELTSFSFDDPSAGVVHVMTGVDTDEMDDDQTTDSDDADEVGVTETITDDGFDSEDDLHSEFQSREEPSTSRVPPSSLPIPPENFNTPHRASTPLIRNTPLIRSAMKSHSTTPSSALKDPLHGQRTPQTKPGHRRSVSFSDGKRDGPIRGLQRSNDVGQGDDTTHDGSQTAGTGIIQSARSRRIEAMMGALETSDVDDDNDSPSKANSSEKLEELQPLAARRPLSNSSKGEASVRVFSRSHTRRATSSRGNVDNTFLTECSFGVSHDRLVQVITDVQPFEPHWEDLSSIDLSKKNVESVARLKEFLPRLDSLTLNSNQLSWLSGVPRTVRTLSVASNNLTGITSYGHLLNLENLDISRNDIDSLSQLSCLRRLRELRADANKIASIDGLQCLNGLTKLSLQGNCIRSADLVEYQWPRLEMLNMSHNRLERISGLAFLPSLIALNLDNNSLGELEFSGLMPRLRILRTSGNRLHQLNVESMRNIRTLYADNNSLTTFVNIDHLTKLENLSLRNQSGRGFNLLTRDIRDVKRLYLSGNPLRPEFLQEPACYNLVYLEMAACRLTSLPPDLVRLIPNLRVLNLNYNFLEDARPLEGLSRLKKLTIIGSRLKGTKPLIRLLEKMPDVEMLDFRMNPCTLGWYLPLLVKDVPGALQPSEGRRGEDNGGKFGWQDMDAKFRRDLPDEAYVGRLAYRGLVMRACPRIRMLDGVEVTEKEKTKAHRLLVGILARGKQSKVSCGGA